MTGRTKYAEADHPRGTDGRFVTKAGSRAKPKTRTVRMPSEDEEPTGGEASYVLCDSLEDWRERREQTPGCSDMKRMLIEGRPPSSFDPEPGSYMDKIFNFGHEWEPRIASEYAKRNGFRERPEDTPIEDLKPGELTRHNLAMYEVDGKVHASLDAVQRNMDGTVTVVEIKTGGKDSFEDLQSGQRKGYATQATVERLVTGADSARIVYAQRPAGFDGMKPEQIEPVTLGSMEVVDVDRSLTDDVRLRDGTCLSDLDMSGLEDACERIRAMRREGE